MANPIHPSGKADESADNSHTTNKSPPSAADLKLIKSFNLSLIEFNRYKELDILAQTKITELLKQRKHLNKFVTRHLEEKINANKQFTALIQLLFPTEHALRYAIKKVDDIEYEINARLPKKHELFDKQTTKMNRLQILLEVAEKHKRALTHEISGIPERDEGLQRRLQNITMIIDEFKEQLQTKQFTIRNKQLKTITDPDLSYFLSKLKTIGITALKEPSLSKNQSSFFKVHIISAMYERFYPTNTNDDSESNKPPKH